MRILYAYLSRKGSYMKKAIEFGKLEELIQDYANKHFEGNFSMAARKLVEKGLSDE